MNRRIQSLLFIQLALLASPLSGIGRQAQVDSIDSLVAKAQQAEAAHDFLTAQNAYKQAVTIDPNVPEIWANLGLMQRATGDTAGAMSSFQHANRLNPSLYVPNLFIGAGYVREGKAAQAIPYLVKAERTNKADPQAPLALGRAYVSIGKFEAATGELNRAVHLNANLGIAWFTLGIARLDQVDADARRMTIEDKDSVFSSALYAESLHQQGRFGEAAKIFKSLLDVQSQPPCLRSEMGFSLLRNQDEADAVAAFAAERTAHPECGLALLGQARLALSSGDKDNAPGLLRELWDRDHGFVSSNASFLAEGLSSEKSSEIAGFLSAQSDAVLPADLRNALLSPLTAAAGDPIGAVAAQSSSPLTSAPQSTPTHLTAQELFAAGQFQQCADRIGADTATLSADRLRLLAKCAFLAGDNQRASEAASALETLEPHSIESFYWSIQANERLAFQALARFQELDPNSATSHVLLGDIYNQLERYEDAQNEYGKALALAPDDPAAMLGLATAYLNNNDMKQADEAVQAALAHSPEDPQLNVIMAEVLIARHDYQGSEPYLAKALHGKPQMQASVHALFGKVYAETGRDQEAIKELKLGAASDVDGSLQYQLARIYRKIGDNKDALAAIERMKEIKDQRRDRGVKRVEDPDLFSLASPPTAALTP